jgi:hypothetical protein
MAANGTEAGPEPPAMGADEWLRRLAELPLAFQPGEGWRYHHSFAVLGSAAASAGPVDWVQTSSSTRMARSVSSSLR